MELDKGLTVEEEVDLLKHSTISNLRKLVELPLANADNISALTILLELIWHIQSVQSENGV